MKKIIGMLMIMALLFTGINTVSAERGVSYKVGDLITVQISDTETRQFYIIEDSTSSENSVLALSKDFLGAPVIYHEVVSGSIDPMVPDGCYVKTWATSNLKVVLETRTSGWTNVTAVSLLSIEQIETILGKTIQSSTQVNSESFSTSSFLYGTNVYYTMSVAQYQPNASLCDVWVINSSTVTQGTGCNEKEVRPVIEVDKEFIKEPDENDIVDNPRTGIPNALLFGGMAILGAGVAILVFRRKNYFTKI